MTFYDDSFRSHTAKITKSFNDIYFVYIDNKFFCSTDTISEAENEVEEYIKKNGYKTLPEVL